MKNDHAKLVRIYNKFGFNLIPCKRGSKEPVKKWKEYQERKSLPTEWGEWLDKGYNVAVVLGKISKNLCCIDVEDKEIARAIFKNFDKLKGETLIVETARGFHIYFRADFSGKREFRTEEGKILCEIRGEDHLAILPPSIHPSGWEYKIVSASEDILPARIKELERRIEGNLVRVGINLRSERVDPNELLRGVSEGGRNEAGIRLATWYRKKRLDKEETLEKLLEWNLKNKPPLLNSEIKAIVNSAYKPEKPYGYKFKELKTKDEIREEILLTIIKEGKQRAVYETAQYLTQNHHFLTLDDTEEVLYYNDGIYKYGGEIVIKREVEEIWSSLAKKHDVNEIIGHIQRMTYCSRKEFDRDKYKIAVENGILDVLEGKLEEFSPEKKHLIKIPVFFDPDIDCPKIKKFVSEIVAEEDVPLIQEMFGYCLLKNYRYNIAFMLLGGGENGKSTLLKLLRKFLGDENVVPASLQELCHDPFAKAELYQKLANIHADLPANPLKQTGNFKMLTGEDRIRGNKKHKEPFNFDNYAKLIFSANELPKTWDMSHAFFRRWIIINFPNVFEGDKKDPAILEKITTREELSGLLNWALEGLQRIIENKGFSFSKTREEVEKEWVLRTDSLRAFVDTCIKYDPEYAIEKDDFYQKYCEFCEEFDISPVSREVVGRRLPQILPKVRWERRMVELEDNNKIQKRLWIGIVYHNDIFNLLKCQDCQVFLTYGKIYKVNIISQKYLENTTKLHICVKNSAKNVRFLEKIREIQKIFVYHYDIQNQNQKQEPLILYDDIVIEAEKKGISEEEVKKILNELKMKGIIYEPRHNRFALV